MHLHTDSLTFPAHTSSHTHLLTHSHPSPNPPNFVHSPTLIPYETHPLTKHAPTHALPPLSLSLSLSHTHTHTLFIFTKGRISTVWLHAPVTVVRMTQDVGVTFRELTHSRTHALTSQSFHREFPGLPTIAQHPVFSCHNVPKCAYNVTQQHCIIS